MNSTVCNRDCPDACRLDVLVVDGRVTSISGSHEDPITRGFICERTRRFVERQHAPDRFPGPMLRRDGRLEPIGWSAALDLAAEKLATIRAESGPAAILHYRSGGSLGILKALSDRFFAAFGPVTVKTGDICSGAGETAQLIDFGLSESHDLADLVNSRLILIWGKNPHTSGIHLLPILKEAQKRGARLVGIEVRETKLRALCDEFHLIRPGGDFALAMATARALFDRDAVCPDLGDYTDGLEGYRALVTSRSLADWAARAGARPELACRLAELLAEESPASIQVGWGLGRRAGGCAAVRALDALAALSGNIGVPGGGVSFYFGRRTAFDQDFGLGPAAEPPRMLREALLGQEILAAREPEIRAVWVTAGNPVTMLPDSGTVREALASREFVVVVDSHPTDTTDVADLVLPCPTLLEDDDLLGAYGNHFLRASTPAVAPAADVLHEVEIIGGLACRLGLEADFSRPVGAWKRLAAARLEARGIGVDRLEREAVINPFRSPVLFADRRFPTASGRMQLITEEPVTPPDLDPEFPLLLLAASDPRSQSSQWSVAARGVADRVHVNPDSSAGLADGDRLILESRHASIEVTLVHDPGVGPGLALMAKGGMLRDGCCPNLLVAARETDAGGGAVYYDEPVRLRPPMAASR
ncbi:MAG: molybdopterin-dependent oxidoreductase [Planctomycetes bacterium]|nr:molybdopterin-dependent oxidoreductase [Planctomycetota bacterium]